MYLKSCFLLINVTGGSTWFSSGNKKNPLGVGLMVNLRSWSLLLSRSQVRSSLVSVSVDKSISFGFK